jgi:hypothetical protein
MVLLEDVVEFFLREKTRNIFVQSLSKQNTEWWVFGTIFIILLTIFGTFIALTKRRAGARHTYMPVAT